MSDSQTMDPPAESHDDWTRRVLGANPDDYATPQAADPAPPSDSPPPTQADAAPNQSIDPSSPDSPLHDVWQAGYDAGYAAPDADHAPPSPYAPEAAAAYTEGVTAGAAAGRAAGPPPATDQPANPAETDSPGNRTLETLDRGDGSPPQIQPVAADPNLLGSFDPQGTLEFPVEFKGAKTTGVIKVNKAYFKPSVKISVSGVPDGDVNVGPTTGRKSSDGKASGQIGVTAEAKRTAQTELTKRFDQAVNSLVKSVTDKDGALKTELFAKAKAEAKGGSKEAAVKVGYDFGLDATIFGMGKATLAVKFTLAGLKYKPSDAIPVSATVLSADVSQKVGIKWKKAFQLGETFYDIEGSVEMGAEFEPNWAEIAKDAAGEVAEVGASAAIMTAIDAAVLAGVPLLAGAVIAQGIYMAGEKGERDAAILEGALDARQAALAYANTILGAEGVATGPRSKAAVAQAMQELARVAASQKMSVDDVMSELRKMAPNPDFNRIYAQARQQVFAAYYGEVARVIKAWRKEHYVVAAWTTEEDDIIAVNKKVAVVFDHA